MRCSEKRQLSAFAVDLGTQDRQASPDRSPVIQSLVILGRSIVPGNYTASRIRKWHALVYIKRFPAQSCLLQIKPSSTSNSSRASNLDLPSLGSCAFWSLSEESSAK